MFYRYLITDVLGSYPLLSRGPLPSPVDGTAELRLLETTEDYSAALRAHLALEQRLRRRKPKRGVLEFRSRGPGA